MEFVLDFQAPPGSDPARAPLDTAERLLACFQFALGHELPNRLVAIQGLARYLLLEEGLSQDVRDLLDNLAGLTRKADELVRALAAAGRLWRDGWTGGPTAPGEVVLEAATEVNLLSPGRPVEYHLGPDLPPLPVPRGGLHQVLTQLLRHAVAAADPARPLRVRLTAERVPGGVELTVADNGRGLDEPRAAGLFEPFAAGDEAGLGLFPVRLAVAGWGGALRVRSEPGQGTAVAVLIRTPPG
jgi:signal transduction histidine kinase